MNLSAWGKLQRYFTESAKPAPESLLTNISVSWGVSEEGEFHSDLRIQNQMQVNLEK